MNLKNIWLATSIAVTGFVASMSSALGSVQTSSGHPVSPTVLVATPVAGAPHVHAAPTLARLSELQDSKLGSMRAGSAATVRPLGTSERAALQQASRDSGQIAALRAGDISNSDLQVVGLVALVLLVFVVLL